VTAVTNAEPPTGTFNTAFTPASTAASTNVSPLQIASHFSPGTLRPITTSGTSSTAVTQLSLANGAGFSGGSTEKDRGGAGGGSAGGSASGSAPDWLQQLFEQVQRETIVAGGATGFGQILRYTECAVKLMQAARIRERYIDGVPPPSDVWTRAAEYWKKEVADSGTHNEQFAITAGAYKFASSCSMRAYRMRQSRAGEGEQKASSRASDAVSKLSDEFTELSRGSRALVSGKIALDKEQAAKVDSALRTLTQLSRSIAFYDTAVVMSRSADAELLDKVPKLENFATITSADLIDAAGRMVTVCREQAANERQAAKEAVAPETLLAVDAASQDHTLT